MPLKYYRPTTPTRRHSSIVHYKGILTTDAPYKSLLMRKKRTAGRNNKGKITIRHLGGGNKKLIRIVDFKRNFPKGFKVISIEYDPNRTAFISLVNDIATGKKKYVLYTSGMQIGMVYGSNNEFVNGNTVLLKTVPVGSEISQIELYPGNGAKLCRGAGSFATLTAREDNYVTIRLPSGEIRKVLGECKAVMAKVANEEHNLVRIGKAGRNRNKGRRPTVRGKVMNPADHPHGGGEARNSIGLKYPKTKWGKPALGVKTRDPKKKSWRLIITRRKNKNNA